MVLRNYEFNAGQLHAYVLGSAIMQHEVEDDVTSTERAGDRWDCFGPPQLRHMVLEVDTDNSPIAPLMFAFEFSIDELTQHAHEVDG
jgi:hypothetical protein